MDEFSQQLSEVKKEACGGAREFSELSPEGKKQCQARLEETVNTLLKIQKDLANADPDDRTVCVIGLHAVFGVKASDFINSFSKFPGDSGRNTGARYLITGGLALTMEKNFTVDQSSLALSGETDEWFLTFERVDDACYALGLGDFMLCFGGTGRYVKFSKPLQRSATRVMFRQIGALVGRVRVIREKYILMGVRLDTGLPMVDDHKYWDKACSVKMLAGMKRKRETGQSLDRNDYGPLKSLKPVDMAKLQAQIKTLYDEECDCLISLREFQSNGAEFEF